LDGWLVTDEQGELIAAIRKLARLRNLVPRVASYCSDAIIIKPRPVVHTSHDAYGYLIEAEDRKIVWAPEFFEFPSWARSADLMFAEAAGWNRPIYFRGGVGGHACAVEVARLAQRRGVQRLVFAHIGRPTIRAMDSGDCLPFGEFAKDGDVYCVSRAGAIRKHARAESKTN
jgi:hypothetical protein